jgi:hypothetical protein
VRHAKGASQESCPLKRALIAALTFPLIAATAACTSIGHEKVEGWPELEIIERRVSSDEMYQRCSKYVAFGMLPMACAEFNLATRRCEIWLVKDFAPKNIVEHERLHCLGYDHVGETAMRDFLTRYRAATEGHKQVTAANPPPKSLY